MHRPCLSALIVLLALAALARADQPKPAAVSVTLRLREGSQDKIAAQTTAKIDVPAGETIRIALTNESGGIPAKFKRLVRVLGREVIPYGVSCELAADRIDDTHVELDAIVSVLGPPVESLDEGKVFPDQSMRGAFTMTPSKAIKIPLPRAWFTTTMNEHQLKTEDQPIWLEIVVEPEKLASS